MGRQHKRWRENILEWSGLDHIALDAATQGRGQWELISHVGEQSADTPAFIKEVRRSSFLPKYFRSLSRTSSEVNFKGRK